MNDKTVQARRRPWKQPEAEGTAGQSAPGRVSTEGSGSRDTSSGWSRASGGDHQQQDGAGEAGQRQLLHRALKSAGRIWRSS